MIKKITLVVCAWATVACTTVQHAPLSSDASAKLQGKSLAATKYPTADFVAMTAGKAVFAVIGAVAMIAEGNSIIKENGIEDPARKISQRLADKLVASRDMRLNTGADKLTQNDSIDALVAAYPSASYLVDVKTLNWLFTYYPADWAHYKIIYSARLRLIDASSKRVVAESACVSHQGDDKNPPSKDQLLENQAALLRKYFDQAADSCVNVLARDILKLQSPDSADGPLQVTKTAANAQPVVSSAAP